MLDIGAICQCAAFCTVLHNKLQRCVRVCCCQLWQTAKVIVFSPAVFDLLCTGAPWSRCAENHQHKLVCVDAFEFNHTFADVATTAK